jgi:peptidoglycan-associated lipoprotein
MTMPRFLLLLAALIAVPASAQVPGLSRRGAQPAPPVQNPVDVLRADFAAQSGGTTVYFGAGSYQLSPQGKAVLAAQASWLRLHSDVAIRIEGYGDWSDTRDHALAMGARRANETRDYLLLLGVPAAQVSAMSWGKERPGPGRAVTTIVP